MIRESSEPMHLLTFTRSVGVSWSPSGRSAYVNNYIGSNATDCLIVRVNVGPVRIDSITRMLFGGRIVRSPNVLPPETPANSHFYLSCKGWDSEDAADVDLSGRTDAGGTFSYEFKYNVKEKTLTLRQ